MSETLSIQCCKKCGASERYSSGDCKVCAKVSRDEYRQKNREKINQQAAKYRKENQEKVKSAKEKWRLANKEKVKEKHSSWVKANPEKAIARNVAWSLANPGRKNKTTRAWQIANPEAVRVIKQNRRARLTNAGGKLSRDISKKLFLYQKGLCVCCGQPLGDDYHIDHIMPLFLGGTNTDDNVQLLRQRCNGQKNTKHPIDFMQSRGFLL